MKPYRYIKSLSESDKIAVLEGIKFGKTHHFRERCRAIELSNRGEKVPQIAYLLNKRCETIYDWFNNWETSGLSGLEIQPGRGLKPILNRNSEELIAEIKKK
jgi:transposase